MRSILKKLGQLCADDSFYLFSFPSWALWPVGLLFENLKLFHLEVFLLKCYGRGYLENDVIIIKAYTVGIFIRVYFRRIVKIIFVVP